MRPRKPLPPERTCIQCGTKYGLRASSRESRTTFAKRKFCSRACAFAYARALQNAENPYEPITPNELKTCPQCGNTIPLRPTDGRAKYEARKYCGEACAVAARTRITVAADGTVTRKGITPMPCHYCGKPRPVRTHDSPSKYKRRKYCDLKCSGAAKRIPDSPERRLARKAAAERRRRRRRKAARSNGRAAAIKAAASEPRKPIVFREKPAPGQYRMATIGAPCPKHPHERVGVYGCPACRTDEKWRETQRTIRPHPAGR